MKRILILVVSILLIALFAVPAMAVKKVTPTKIKGGEIVTAETVKELLGKAGVYIFDMRKAINYGKGHVPGAVSNPYKWIIKDSDPAKRTGSFDTTKLPKDKNTTLVFYSDGPTGWKSYYASMWAIEAGYKRVLYMREGSAAWFSKGMPTE